MSHKGIFEDSDDDFESESGEDFSASEDEWKPGKDDKFSEEDDDEIVANASSDDVSDEGNVGSKKKNSKKSKAKAPKRNAKASTSNASSKGRQTSSLRSKLFRRYNPPPKTTSTSPVSAKVADILSNSQYKERKKMPSTKSAAAVFSDSDSSEDDGLVNPKELDFNSKFFDVKANNRDQSDQTEPNAPPVFDCNAGMNLSDSSNDEDEEFDEVETDNSSKKPSIINKINSKSSNEMHDFSSLQDFAKNLESAKAQLEKLKQKDVNASTSKSAADESDITKLLSLGEGGATTSTQSPRKRKHKDGQRSDDSDWENVSDNDDSREIKDIEITVGNTAVQRMTRDQKKAVDLEACLKRRLIRDIKQRQIWLHKSSVLCWIAHGNYINRVLNNMTLMEMCLKLLPSKNAYPKGDTDVKYYHMITDWFHSLFQLKSDKLYCPLKKLPPKTLSLALQLKSKKIISKCDFVLLFVTMLRSLGLQCRLVINLAVPPQQPPQKDLFVISTKPKETEDAKSDSKKKSDSKSLGQKIKVSAERVKKSLEEKPSTSNAKRSERAPAAKSKKLSKPKPQHDSEHSYAGSDSSPVKSPKSKTTLKTSKIKNTASDHSYAETHVFDRVKVKLPRMSEAFLEEFSEEPNSQKHGIQSPSSKSKKTKDPHADGKSKYSSQESKKDVGNAAKSEDSPNKSKPSKELKHVNGASTKLYEDEPKTVDSSGRLANLNRDRAKNLSRQPSTRAGRQQLYQKSVESESQLPSDETVSSMSAETETAKSEESPNESKPSKKLKLVNGVSTKHKLVERTNSIESPKSQSRNKRESIPTGMAFSPRKTRSKVSKVADVVVGAKAKSKLKLPQLDGAHDDIDKKRTKTKAKAKARKKEDDDSKSDSDFAPTPQKRIRAKITPPKPVNKALVRAKQIDSRVFSTDEENDVDVNTVKMNFWVEAYAEKEKKWIVIDPVKRKVDAAEHVRKHASKPIIYVFAWNNDNTIRDVTPRYCSQFHTTTRKLRAEQLWIDDALERFIERRSPRTIIEDVEFSKLHMDTPMPTSINEFKNHPLYALERHLLKFEAIYPQNALTLGYIRNEPVYSRDCVHTCRSREIWVKEARTVKVGEKPYKIVKARPKWNRMLNQMEEAKPLEIFGIWQTEPYQPPVAENGLVPRNAYGNVELFKPEMLPIGTRHIQLPNLNRVCKKMGIDCAQAVIGFDFHGGSSHPTFDGFVVCEEFADDVIKQWEIEQEEQIRKENDKRNARVFGNWKKLIKGLLIRERLKRKFNFGADQSPEKKKKK